MSLINTRLLNFRADAPVDKNEQRASVYGVSETFAAQTMESGSIISDDLLTKAMRSEGSTLEIPVIDALSTTVTNVTQPCVIVDNPATSQQMAVTFVDYYFGFLIHPAKHFNNEISMQREFETKLKSGLLAYKALTEGDAITALEAAKTQILTDTLGGRYSIVSDIVTAPLAEQDAVVGDINLLQMGNDFYGQMDIIGNPAFGSHVRNRLAEQGQYNDRDKSYQFSDKNIRFSNQVTNDVLHKATCFAVEKGSLGKLERFSADCQLGNITHNHQWSIESMPMIGERFGTMSYDDCVDYSATGAHTARLTSTKVEAYGFHKSVAYVVAYNSDVATLASPIMKVGIAKV